MLNIISNIAIGALGNLIANLFTRLVDYVLARKNDHPSRK